MRLTSTPAALLAVVLAASGCTPSSDPPEIVGGERRAGPSPASSVRCPTLTAEVPGDLVRRKPRHSDRRAGFGPSVGVTFNNRALTREVSLGTATADRVVGHGLPGVRRRRTIDGVPATEVVNGDTRTYMWRHDDASHGCSYWSVTTVGLSDREVERVLDSVRESS